MRLVFNKTSTTGQKFMQGGSPWGRRGGWQARPAWVWLLPLLGDPPAVSPATGSPFSSSVLQLKQENPKQTTEVARAARAHGLSGWGGDSVWAPAAFCSNARHCHPAPRAPASLRGCDPRATRPQAASRTFLPTHRLEEVPRKAPHPPRPTCCSDPASGDPAAPTAVAQRPQTTEN